MNNIRGARMPIANPFHFVTATVVSGQQKLLVCGVHLGSEVFLTLLKLPEIDFCLYLKSYIKAV